MEGQALVEVRWSFVVQGLESVGEHLELASLLDWEPVKLLEVGGDVGLFRKVEDESCC